MLVLIRPRALNDLVDIWTYIAESSTDQADAFVTLLDNKFKILARQPTMGRTRSELAIDLRSFAVGRYIIFYLMGRRGVEIVRVLHGARDIESVFQEDEQ